MKFLFRGLAVLGSHRVRDPFRGPGAQCRQCHLGPALELVRYVADATTDFALLFAPVVFGFDQMHHAWATWAAGMRFRCSAAGCWPNGHVLLRPEGQIIV